MVVECPECGTSFQLPTDKLSSKGSKLRCSKCGHTFRVRLNAAGTAEIFYKEKNENVGEPPTQELSDLFDDPDGFDAMFSKAGQVRVHPEESDEVDPRSTVVGRPTSGRVAADPESPNRTAFGPPAAVEETRSKSASQSYNPFPFAGAVKTTSPSTGLQEPSINLFEDEDEEPAPTFTPTADPFGDAFAASPAPESPIEETPSILQAGSPKLPAASAAVLKPLQPGKPLGVTLPDAPEPQQAQGADLFGSIEDMVDPSFGEETPSFDPNLGRVVAPPTAAAPPRTMGPPTGQRPAMAPPAAAPRPQAAPVVGGLEADPILPHRIGGGGFQKFVNFLFLLVIALAGFLGYIAFKMDGLLDFKDIDQMLGVAFEGKTYEPRKEWIPAPLPPEPAPVAPVVSEDVFARVVSVGRRDAVMVVSGMLRNQSDAEVESTRARIILLDATQKVVAESTVSSGRVIPGAEIAAAKSLDDIRGLSPDTAKPIAAKGSQPIQAIFFDLPQHVLDNLELTLRVEIITP
jgi:predicted Zn finger-like uncharacterized protein